MKKRGVCPGLWDQGGWAHRRWHGDSSLHAPVASLGLWAAWALRNHEEVGKMLFPGLGDWGTCSAPVPGTGMGVFGPCDTGPTLGEWGGPWAAGAAGAGAAWPGRGMRRVASQPRSPRRETAEQVKPVYVVAAKESVPSGQGCTRACPAPVPDGILRVLPLV